MKRRRWFPLCLIVLCVSTYALYLSLPSRSTYAQTTEVIDVGRRIDWSQAGVPGGIPNRANGTCATLDPGATAADITTAIAACNNGVVYLNAGTYALSSGITFRGASNVTLRGAGPDQTIVRFSGGNPDPCGGYWANVCVTGRSIIWSGNVPAGNVRNWTAGCAKGT